jgi:uncharacterized protein (DUF1697 family)
MAKQCYVALLRGINVGTAKRVAMADLRALVEELGYADVRTLLNSGNVVFSARSGVETRDVAHRIEKALKAKQGVSARVMVISAEKLAEVIAANPLVKVADNPSRLLVGIMGDPAYQEKLTEIVKKDWGREKIVCDAGRAVYMWIPQGVIESKLNAAVSKALGDGVTARNWATMLKLKEMTEQGDG